MYFTVVSITQHMTSGLWWLQNKLEPYEIFKKEMFMKYKKEFVVVKASKVSKASSVGKSSLSLGKSNPGMWCLFH